MAVGDIIGGDKVTTQLTINDELVTDGPHKGKWRRQLLFCNITSQPITVLITDNPWKDSNNPNPWANKLYKGEKDENGKYTKESGTIEAKENGKKYTLSSKAAGNNCVRLTYYYPWKPSGYYTDIYEAAPDGSIKKKPVSGNSTAGATKPVKVGMLPQSPKVSYAAVIPLPYPISVESVADGPIDVAIDRIEGLPEEFELIGTLPPIGQPHRVEPGDRMSSAVVYFRQNAPMTKERVTVTAFQKVVWPEEVADWSERRLMFDLENGETPLTASSEALLAELEEDLSGIIVVDSYEGEPARQQHLRVDTRTVITYLSLIVSVVFWGLLIFC